MKRRRTDLEKWSNVFHSHCKLTPQLLQLQKDAESQVPGRISFQLPEIGAVAGKALLHAMTVLDRLFESWSPLLFKIGWTSNCVSRWCNHKYGYGISRDQWYHMITRSLNVLPLPGMPGCRNVRAGGDTAIPDQSTLDGQLPPVYMVYAVYRSFKYPPAVKSTS